MLGSHYNITYRRTRKNGYALSKLKIVQIDSSQSLKQPATLYNLTLVPNKPGEHYRLGISRLDSVIVTKNGNMPILAFGNINEIKVDHIVITTMKRILTSVSVLHLIFSHQINGLLLITKYWIIYLQILLTRV